MPNVGIIGIGFMGMMHYLAYQKIRGVKVRALCEQDPKRLAGDWRSIKGNFGPPGEIMDLSGIAKYAEVDEMLADPSLDLIDVCLPPSLHADITIAALKAGKHVFCEKPIALKAADGRRMVEAAERCGKLLLIGHVLPFFPEFNFACKIIQSGKYGKIRGGHFTRMISDPAWLPDYFNPDKVGGPFHPPRLRHAAASAKRRHHARRGRRAILDAISLRRSRADRDGPKRRHPAARPPVRLFV
jgi:predicted dehydrogenase